MSDHNWKEIDKLLDAAFELSPEKRKAFLNQACGDNHELRKEVEALLSADERAQSFIEAPALVQHSDLLSKDQELFDHPFPFTFGHYQVLHQIGEGGMGKVYLAEDKSLSRKVALKILRGGFAKEPGRLQRFQNEARAASSLNHPNILTVYETGQENGIPFIATEYVEGKTLRVQLSSGKIRIRDAVEIAIQICSALAPAHEAGIVHRDIKPENIMLRPDGIVKVLDFGVAKMIQTADSNEETKTNITMEGEVIGTVKYMSPEQVRGQSVDARSDIFSLGIVLFEMLTGALPFEGKTKSDVIAAILHNEISDMANYLPDIPKELEAIILKMLQKDPQDRYQTERELLKDLKPVKQSLDSSADTDKIHKASSNRLPQISFKFLAVTFAIILVALAGYYQFRNRSANIESIAVLPFINEGKQSELEYLTDGITETIIRGLSRHQNLKVMAQSTVFRYKRKVVDARTVGKDLGVQVVLTGRVMQKGKDLQITLELADARDNSYIWSNQYHGKIDNLLSIQSDIANDISNRLSNGEKGIIAERSTDNVEAYNLYLKGRFFWNKRTKDGLEKAIAHFRQALDVDPSYALAWSGLADCYISQTFYQYSSPKEAMLLAKAAATKALEIDESLAEAHITLAHVAANFDWDWKASEKEFKRGIELNPNYATAHQWYAMHYLMPIPKFDDALTELKKAQQLDPLSPLMTSFLGEAFYFSRRYKEAENECRKALELEPNFPVAHWHLGLIYEQQGLYDEAIAQHRKAIDLSGGSPRLIAALGHAFAVAGKREEALQVIEQLNQREYVSALEIASIYLALGDQKNAFEFLEKAFNERSFHITYLKIRPEFDSIRNDPRFENLIRGIGLEI